MISQNGVIKKLYPILHKGKTSISTISLQQPRRQKINEKNRSRLQNKDFCLISSNCNGGVVCHDLGQPFRTQFVNLWMYPKDFIRYLSDLDYYNSIDEITFVPESERGIWDFPIGLIDGMRIYFTHYHSEEEAVQKWNERKHRMDKNNLFIMMSEQNGCTKEDLMAFDQLPFANKVVFTQRPYADIKSAFYIRGFENAKELGTALSFTSPISAKRYIDQFPYVDWFNGDNVFRRT